MIIEIVMVNGTTFDFENDKFNNLSDFIENQVCKDYYTIDPKHGLAIRTSNIISIKHCDIQGVDDE